jgi:hypothetical protein
MKKRLISIPPTAPSLLKNMTACLDTFLETPDYTSPASVFIAVKKAIRPGAKLRTFLETIAVEHASTLDAFPALVTQPEFWKHTSFPHSNAQSTLSFDSSNPSLSDISLVAYLAGNINTVTFEALQQIHIFRREFELANDGTRKEPVTYSCMTPHTKEITLSTIPVATPFRTPSVLESSHSIVHSLTDHLDQIIAAMTNSIMLRESRMPVRQSLKSPDGSPNVFTISKALSDALSRVPEHLRFFVTAPDARPSSDRQEWHDLLFRRQDLWPHLSSLESSNVMICLSVPIVREVSRALYDIPVEPQCAFGPLGVDRLGELHQLNRHPVALMHTNLRSNPFAPHDIEDGGAMLMAHDIGFHIPWTSSKPPETRELFLTVMPQILKGGLAYLDTQDLPDDINTHVSRLVPHVLEYFYDIEELLFTKDEPKILDEFHAALQLAQNHAYPYDFDTPPFVELSSFSILCVAIGESLRHYEPKTPETLHDTTQHHISEAKRHSYRFIHTQLSKLHQSIQFSLVHYKYDIGQSPSDYINHLGDVIRQTEASENSANTLIQRILAFHLD